MNVPGGQYTQHPMQSGAVATGNGTPMEVCEESTGALTAIAIQITGINGDTITFEATIDGVTWVGILAENVTTGAESTTATANGIYRITCLGVRQVRARISTYSAGTIVATGLGVA